MHLCIRSKLTACDDVQLGLRIRRRLILSLMGMWRHMGHMMLTMHHLMHHLSFMGRRLMGHKMHHLSFMERRLMGHKMQHLSFMGRRIMGHKMHHPSLGLGHMGLRHNRMGQRLQ
jgi:hypothetical protein